VITIEEGEFPMKLQSLGASLALLLTLSPAAWPITSQRQHVTLTTNRVLEVKLNQTLSSDRNRRGDSFTASVHDPSLPDGTIVRGVVIGARPAGTDQPGQLGLDFRTLELPNGKQVPISGTAIGLDDKNVRRTSDGRLVATSAGSKNTGKYVAYGAAGGLLIGSILGKNVVGGLLGAGAGYLIGKNKDKKAEQREVTLKEGTKLGVRLDQRVVLARSWLRGTTAGG
jgi:hypothetical protein